MSEPTTEVLYADGSRSGFMKGGGSFHEGEYAMMRMRLLMAKSALSIYIRSGGKMQVTRNGAQQAIKNVIEPITGKKYKRSMAGKQQALDDCETVIAHIEHYAVVMDSGDE